MTLEEARRFALSLPGATEEPHFELASFRVRGKIFATVPEDGETLRVFVPPDDVAALAAADPAAFEPLWWGKRVVGVRIALAAADPAAVCELLEDAWRMRAPKRVVAAYDDQL